ncbi:cytochrome c family protein [Novosphingobium sp. P6W]|uniref:c-type cytochrome n=1 Tax=Novosphingobium sp. P6W TaxID=1609758 RepID=UPI0005C2B104|nr:c-type cytochrome [Novosphingobium sp. P6W]AXB75391.1 cytochrome C [Novosphingobium sp. P6W]KIS32571.1 cytochrome C [Novosphingobium sp. P6W]
MTTTSRATMLMIPLSALLTACGGNAPDDAATPSASPTPASAIVDPAPPAFAVCRSCHSTQSGQNGIGPTLAGIAGSRAGNVPGYTFSPALKNSGIIWDRASLDNWLQGPMKMVPGTKMVLPVSDPAKRKAIIDYLETLK